ncbi:sulfate ABC transporter substrate-binding protein [Nocardioides nematodiphilus]|uniref:sulfate ABC transporter substrate-binding protein n=1 Tax=Nocardioides nematodiphilus TaxID=2849669 RepID=UPI001CD9AAE8|nr:sulfate ABC transporter substrate-binding protein [Nocardioides nematodiphilus]MCA1981527.1 sulfate ABC transporter substrate-binding protein [Nocardioides nematodiphilus]
MKSIKVTVAAVSAAGVLALTGCGSNSGSSAGGGADTINVVGYSVLQQANKGVEAAFEKTADGKNVEFKESYGASGDQSRAVLAGAKADEVHLSLEPDVQKLVDAGIVADDWKNNATKGICTQSIVVFGVRPGNPKNIKTWADLTKPGVQIVTPNPASSGSAKWNLLAAYGSALGNGGDAGAAAYMKKFFANVAAMPDSGRDATTAFTGGTGDVLLSYENEVILARQSGTDLDYVVPDSSLLIQNPCAVTKDAAPVAQKWLDFQKSADGQKLYEETGYRPLDSVASQVGDVDVKGVENSADPFPAPAKLLTIDQDFGGWADANTKYFDADKGVLTKLQAAAGK